jgi:hypothetical protein
MTVEPTAFNSLLHGPLWSNVTPWPLTVCCRFGDVRPRFLAKGKLGRGHRAVARDGRVLLISDMPLSQLAGTLGRVRFQTWHKPILPGDPPEPYGVLMVTRALPNAGAEPVYAARLASISRPDDDLALDVGGRMWLVFHREVG